MHPSRTKSRERSQRIDLGIAIAHAITPFGQCLTPTQIAAFCDCSQQAISEIERKAMRKLRHRWAALSRHKPSQSLVVAGRVAV